MRDRIVGVELAGEVGDLLRLHRLDQRFADMLVHLGEHVGVDDPGERFDQPLALVARGKFDQVGDVGRMERLDQLARGLVVAGVDRVEHLVDEFRPQPVFGVHRALVSLGHRARRARRRYSRSRSCASLPTRGARLLLPGLHWRNRTAAPKCVPSIPLNRS